MTASWLNRARRREEECEKGEGREQGRVRAEVERERERTCHLLHRRPSRTLPCRMREGTNVKLKVRGSSGALSLRSSLRKPAIGLSVFRATYFRKFPFTRIPFATANSIVIIPSLLRSLFDSRTINPASCDSSRPYRARTCSP